MILRPGSGTTWINGKQIDDYFPRISHRKAIMSPLETTELAGQYDLRVRVHGGGASGQAGAIRHGIARALVEINPDFRVMLKRQGSSRGTPARSSARRPACTRRARRRSSRSGSRSRPH